MLISVNCSRCQLITTEDVQDSYRGKKVNFQCPNCNKIIEAAIPNALDITTYVELGLKPIRGLSLKIHEDHSTSTKKQIVDLKPGVYVVGRKSKSLPSDINVNTLDRSMSRNHFQIKVNSTHEIAIKDLSSKNGLFLNRDKMRHCVEVYLNEKDLITAGAVNFRVEFKR